MKLVCPSGSEVHSGKILAIFPGALGDFICFLPALKKLAAYKEAYLLARAEYADLLPSTVAAGSLERYEVSRLFVPEADRDDRLKRFFGSYAFLYSWMGNDEPLFVRNLQGLSKGNVSIFPFRPSDIQMPMAAYYLSCLGEWRQDETFPAISIRSDALDWSECFRRRNGLTGKKVLAMAPGSGAREKNWPVQFYRAVAEWWERVVRGKVIVVLGPVEEEREVTENLWSPILEVRGLGLAKVAALLARCDCYLGNDSGISHLAAALGVETVAIFGPTDPVRWAPRGKRVTVVSTNVECSPCADSVMKACPHRKCMNALSPSHVMEALERIVERPSAVEEVTEASLTRKGSGIRVKVKNG